MRGYLRSWNFMRILRFVVGVFIVVQGVQSNQWMIVALGGVFALMPLFNIGGCGPTGCNVPSPREHKSVKGITCKEVE